jgi:hypothetical protein
MRTALLLLCMLLVACGATDLNSAAAPELTYRTVDVPLGQPSDPSSFQFVPGPFALQQLGTATPWHFAPVALPDDLLGDSAAEICDVFAWFVPIAGHSTLPAEQPAVSLWTQPVDGSSPGELVQQQTLPAGSVLSYETPQRIVMMLDYAEPLTSERSMWIGFVGESGSGAMRGLLLTRLAITVRSARP